MCQKVTYNLSNQKKLNLIGADKPPLHIWVISANVLFHLTFLPFNFDSRLSTDHKRFLWAPQIPNRLQSQSTFEVKTNFFSGMSWPGLGPLTGHASSLKEN